MSSSYFHRGGLEPLLGATIPEHFAAVVAQYPQHEAVVSLPQGRRLVYAELNDEIDRLARGLMATGFAKGDRIGIWSTNNIEWLLLQMASARIGAVLVNINPAYRSKELAFALQRSQVQGLFLIPAFRSSDYLAMLQQLLPELSESGDGRLHSAAFPMLRTVVVYDPANPQASRAPSAGFLTWQQVLRAGEDVTAAALQRASESLDRDDVINIQYTSGTTGFPKAVQLTHHNILNNAWFAAHAMAFGADERLCVPVPFYHCFGMVLCNLLCLSVGACVVIACEHFDAGLVLRAVDAERCTALHGVPTMFVAELEHPDFASFDLSSLRTGIMAGAPCPPALVRQVMQDMHCSEILIGYGETEASPLTHLTLAGDSPQRRSDTVGSNLPHQEVKIVARGSGECLPLGETGEVCFRGYHVMRGYYGDPEATAEAVDRQGWLHSGDLGWMDGDGYLRITGRLKEMVIRGGENIYPREIEDLLFGHPKIAAAAVFGVPDDYYGEELMAWVRLHAGEASSEEELKAYLHGRIAHFKIPKRFWFVDAFPMTVTGKLQKFRMREQTIEWLAQGYSAAPET